MYLVIRCSRLKRYLLAAIAAAVLTAVLIRSPALRSADVSRTTDATLVIDPGHGGVDGGAISVYGIKESDINLAVALKMQALAQLCGQPCVMTRTSDESYTNYPDYSEHAELVHRVDITNAQSSPVLISIHQNCFPDPRPCGTQILYAATNGSKEFAWIMEKNFLAYVDSSNRRVAQPVPKSLYVTANVSCPALLMECGFLSNAQDSCMLADDTYQTKLAVVMLASFLQYKDTEI